MLYFFGYFTAITTTTTTVDSMITIIFKLSTFKEKLLLQLYFIKCLKTDVSPS